MLKHGILGLLNYGSMTGYDIVRIFKDSLSYFWQAQTSQIYRELQTIKKNGWATDETVLQNSKPDKKIFTITESGKEELKRWLTKDSVEFELRSPLMMKVFFRGELSVEENIEYFKSLVKENNDFDCKMYAAPPETEKYAGLIDDSMKAIYWKMTVEYGIMYSKMHRQWLENCIRRLEELKYENPDN